MNTRAPDGAKKKEYLQTEICEIMTMQCIVEKVNKNWKAQNYNLVILFKIFRYLEAQKVELIDADVCCAAAVWPQSESECPALIWEAFVWSVVEVQWWEKEIYKLCDNTWKHDNSHHHHHHHHPLHHSDHGIHTLGREGDMAAVTQLGDTNLP